MEGQETTIITKGVQADGRNGKIAGTDSSGSRSSGSGSSSDGSSTSGSGKAGSGRAANGRAGNRDSGNQASGAGSQGSSGSYGSDNSNSSGASSGSSGSNRGAAGTGTGRTGGTAGAAAGNQDRKTETVLEKVTDGLTPTKPPKPVKPSLANSKKKGTAAAGKLEVTSPDFLSMTLSMAFGVLATMTKHEHWKLNEGEAEAVAEPLSLVLDQLPAKTKQKMNKATAPVMLGAALATILIPRVAIEVTMYKGGVTRGRNQPTNGGATQGNHSESAIARPAADKAGDTKAATNVRANVAEVDPAISQLLNGLG